MNEQQRAELERIRDVLYPATGLEDYDEEIIGRVLKDINALLTQDAQPKQDVPETNFGNMADPKIGCVNHDCDKCKAAQPAPVQPVGDWIWSWLMDWCKSRGVSPSTQDSLFKMVKDARGKFESTSPAQPAVPLTSEKAREICDRWTDENGNTGSFGRYQIIRDTEAAHGIVAAPEKGQP